MGCTNTKELQPNSQIRNVNNDTGSIGLGSSLALTKGNYEFKEKSSATPTCHFCNKMIPSSELNFHTVHCDEREVTCWNSWCREKIRLGELQKHMEHCVKKQTAICPKCGKSVLVIDLRAHTFECTPYQCPHCPEKCIGRLLKYCPVQMLGKFHLTVGPFATESLRAKFAPHSRNGSPLRSHGAFGVPPPEVNFNVARIQHLFRWVKTKTLIEDTIFRLIHKEMDLKKESFAIFKAHDIDPNSNSPHLSRRSRSILQASQVAPSTSDHYFPAKSTIPITAEHITKMLFDLTNHVLLPYNAAWRVFTDTLNHLNALPNVVRLTPAAGARYVNGRLHQGGKMIVVGDLHGQMSDLLHILWECGMPSESTFYVFNGDFVDRGAYGVEVLLILFSLMLAFPKSVALNRGNHECDYMNEEYGFDVEVTTKYDRNIFRLIQRCFCALPLATIIDNKIFIVHGGLPRRKGCTINDLQRVQRFRQIPMPEHSQPEEDEIFQDLLWSDPYDGLGWQESERGAGVQFGADVTTDFLELNKLQLVIRSHEEFVKGYQEHHDGRLVTVFSASNYDGVDTNNGAFIVLAGDNLDHSFHTFQVYEDDFINFNSSQNEQQLQMTVGGKDFSSVPNKSNPFGLAALLRCGATKRRNSKDEVLRVLWERIYQRRHRLNAYFSKLDSTQKGSLWKIEWAETMRNVLNLDIPWFFLRRYVAEEDETTTRIYYSKFLSRFHSRLMSLWMGDWQKDAVRGVMTRQRNTKAVLKRVFVKDRLNYNEFCSGMREVDHTLSDASLFQLFQYFDPKGTATVETAALLAEFENDTKRISSLRWDLDAMEQLQNVMIQGRTQLYTIFKTSSKDMTLTKDKFMYGMQLISKGLKKEITPDQMEAMWAFIVGDKHDVHFDKFLAVFSVFDTTSLPSSISHC
eukprot:Tbor_TRINITY_DN5650_c3_g2::TRINITY_DN5650_c3_g2_i4::g.8998::m.8998/K04460/PPP5C; serine/threonine-protein phosphatase 5